jgi:hypothetical protein
MLSSDDEEAEADQEDLARVEAPPLKLKRKRRRKDGK